MPARDILFSEKARRALADGARQCAQAVGSTMGPRGRNVMLDKKWGAPTITKDGVTVAKEVELEDKFENMGAALMKEIASKTNDVAGDGTTTAVVLGHTILKEGRRAVTGGANPVFLKRGMERALDASIQNLKSQAIPISTMEETQNVATIAGNDAEIGKFIADAMDKAGKDGVITVEEGRGTEDSLDVVEGMQFDKGWTSPYMVTDPENMEAVLEEPYILICEKKITNAMDLVPLMEKSAKAGKALVIISESVEGDALATMVLNKLRNICQAFAVKAPAFGDRRKAIMDDLAVLTKGKFFSEDLGIKLENIELNELGTARRVTIEKENTTIVEGAGSKKDIAARIEQIRRQIDDTDSEYDREKLEERLAKLAGGVAIIRVGAATETELKERKSRFEDSLNATRAAVDEGIVAGGGVALLRAQQSLGEESDEADDEQIGAGIVKRALEGAVRQIASNAGIDGSVVVDELRKSNGNRGFDAQKLEYRDMVDAGIIDPLKVVRTALENAVSIATVILTTEAAIVDKPDEDADTA